MNDDFLMRIQPEVRPEFAEVLAGKLRRQARRQNRYRRMFAAVVVVVLALSSLMILPEVRAAVQRMIWKIGDMVLVECSTYEECLVTSKLVRLAYADDPDQRLRPGTYRIETIVDDLPFLLSLPKVMGGPYVYNNLVHLTKEQGLLTAELNWHHEICIDTACETALNLTIAQSPDDAPAPVPEGATAEPLQYFPRGRAFVYRDPKGESGIAWCERDDDYHWKEQLCYRMSWVDPDLSLDPHKMSAAANSLTYAPFHEPARHILYADLLAAYPDVTHYLPAWVPEGFTLEPERIIMGKYDTSVGIIWSSVVTPTESGIRPWFSMSIWEDHIPWMVKEGTLQELEIGAHPAALYEMAFSTEEDPLYGLMWRQYGLQYSVAWPTRSITTEDILKTAASVPETGRLPLPPGQVDDLLRLLLAEGSLKTYPMESYPSP